MGGGSVVIGRQSGFKRVGENSRFDSSDNSPIVKVGLQGFGKSRVPYLAFIDILFAGNSLKNVVVIAALATGLSCKGCNGKPDTFFIDSGQIDGLPFGVGDFKSHHRLSVSRYRHASNFGIDTRVARQDGGGPMEKDS